MRDAAESVCRCLRMRKGWVETELKEWSASMKKSHRRQENAWG